MLEIVHDLAPGAQLFFSGPATNAQMVDSINWLVGQGVDVIVDDLGWFNEPYFQDGPVAQAAASAVANGVVYVSAAGNESPDHYQGGYVQGLNSGAGFWHDFDPGPGVDIGQGVTIPPGGTFTAFLQWSDPFGGSANNYDLYLFRASDNAILTPNQGTDVQNGDDNPTEAIQFVNTSTTPLNAFIAINRVSGAARELELWTFGDTAQQYTTVGDAIFGHPAANGAIAVAAVNSGEAGNDNVAGYSSRGPSTVYTNFATQTSVQRNSLDGAGIDGVQTRIGQLGHFANPFFGTSAAAPHVAAIAALVLDANPGLTPAQVTNLLTRTAIDIEAAGYDQLSGNGRFDALRAVSAAMGDFNLDGLVNRHDLVILAGNFGRPSGALPLQGDMNGDGKVSLRDLVLLRDRCACNQTQSLLGSGEGGGMESLEVGQPQGDAQGTTLEREENVSTESGGSGSSAISSATPARIYLTFSGSTSGGGALGESVPEAILTEPGDYIDVYVWVTFGTYQRIYGYGMDLVATNPGVVKATASEVYNSDIVDSEYGEPYGTRWNPSGINGGSLNSGGVGAAELVTNARAVAIGGGMELRDAFDGQGTHYFRDTLYDAANDAFLVQRVRLEALSGTTGLSTGLVLKLGAAATVIDGSTAFDGLPIYFGLGTTEVATHNLGTTDGTTHAIIAVAAPGSPGAVMMTKVPRTARTTVSDPVFSRVDRLNVAQSHFLRRSETAIAPKSMTFAPHARLSALRSRASNRQLLVP